MRLRKGFKKGEITGLDIFKKFLSIIPDYVKEYILRAYIKESVRKHMKALSDYQFKCNLILAEFMHNKHVYEAYAALTG